MIACNLCGKKIPDTFVEKFRHEVQSHPEYFVLRIRPLLTGQNAFTFGEQIAEKLKAKLCQPPNR